MGVRNIVTLVVGVAAMVSAQSAFGHADSTVLPECGERPWIVFFDPDSSNIDPTGVALLDKAIAAYQSCGEIQIMIAGRATKLPDGPRYSVKYSQRRADTVRAYLASRGIPDGVVTTQAFGETKDGSGEAQSRRIEIVFGPGAGW